MIGTPDDVDLIAAGNPTSPPRLLADIAARRHDLHGVIAGNPQAYPELRRWMEQVNPGLARPVAPTSSCPAPYGAAAYPVASHPPAMRPRRTGLGWVFGGCGCLTLIAGLVVVGVVLAGLGASTAGAGGSGSGGQTGHTTDDPIAAIQAESAEYQELAAQLDGNPVAPLIAPPHWFERFQNRASAPSINEFQANALLTEIQTHRAALQQKISDAEARRSNASGTIAEELVDSAGNGFIDILWDADSACSTADEPGHTTAGCTSTGSSVAVHVLPADRQLGGDEGARLVVLHELAHLYQYADIESSPVDGTSRSMTLKEQGMFQSSGEAMSDCYALTYLNSYSLTVGDVTFGYGYVCNDTERQAIREWAEHLHAPMPG